MTTFLLASALAISGALLAADGGVAHAVQHLDELSGQAPKALAVEFRLRAAESLQERHPDLARKEIEAAVAEILKGKDLVVGDAVVSILARLSPDDAIGIMPHLADGSTTTALLALVRAHHIEQALALEAEAVERGALRAPVATTLISILARARPADAARLFAESLAAFGDPLSPGNAWWIANTAGEVAPDVAAPALERVLKAASAPGYGEDAPAIKMTLVLGKTTIEATSTRETLLIVAGARLRAVAPDRLEKYKPVLVKWDLSGPLQIRSMAPTQPVPLPPSLATEISIIKAMGQIRAKATDRERAQVVKNLAEQINQMPAEQPRLTRIRGLANLSTEGDLGKEALTAVAKTLGETMRDVYPKMIAAKMTSSYGDGYIELAKLVRYERVPAPFADPALDAADALLSLREQIQGENGFSLTGLDGKTYSLANLKGRIVLLNFWATWCPPCRKEMPDMETLYKKYEKAGLTILAVSDEDRATVEQFLAKTSYSFPVLLDMDRKVHTSFMVEGIPKSFIFDREGRLAAQAIDMRTEAQFMDLLRLAGLE